jgi:hypothetical protein
MKQLWVLMRSAKLLVVLIFLLPMIVGLLCGMGSASENRRLVEFPELPRSIEEAVSYPGQINLWINDHMALRQQLIEFNNSFRYFFFRQFPTVQTVQGAHGRIFLGAHNATDEPYWAILGPCGYQFNRFEYLQSQLNLFAERTQRYGVEAQLLIAPSASVVYQEDLPHWLEQRCRLQFPPIQQALDEPGLSLQARAVIYYPLVPLLDAKEHMDVFPRTWFHWGGSGTHLAADLAAQQFWGLPASAGMQLKSSRKSTPSDISHLFPGVRLASVVDTIDFGASGIGVCMDASCLPEVPGVNVKLYGLTRYHNHQAPNGALLLVADSFGLQIAPWFAGQFKDVLQIATNNLAFLDAEETRRLREFIVGTGGKSRILFVYHDNSIQAGRIGIDLDALLP